MQMNQRCLTILLLVLAVLVIPSVHADNLEFEKQWLEFEASYLEGKIKFMDNLDIFKDATVLGNYQKQLKYVRGLYHCSKMGYSVGDILDHIKIMAASNGIIRTHPCIRDYVVKSKSSGVHLDYLLEYMKDNPTFNYLKNRAESDIKSYEEVFVNKALELEQDGRYTEAGDIYGRIITYILGTDNNFRTQVGWGILNTNTNDRNLIRTLYSCTKDWDVENPFSEIWEKTNNRKEYNAGIPCVDQNTQGTGRVIVYKTLAVAIRSDTFISLVKMSRNKDGNLYTDDILYTLKRYGLIREQVDKLEDRNANSNFVSYEMYQTLSAPSDNYIEIITQETRNNPSANALHRIAALRQKMNYLVQIKPKTVTYAQLKAVKEGVKGCAAGFVGGFTTWEGAATNVGFFVAGGLTTVLSGGTSLVMGGIVFASGSYLMYEGFKDISTQWDQLDLEGKSEAACSIIMPIVMQGAGTKVFHSAAGKAKSYIKSRQGIVGKESIWTKDLASTEKIKTMIAKARKGKTVTEPATFVVEQTPLKLFIEELKIKNAAKLKVNDPRLRKIEKIGGKIKYNELSVDEQAIFKELSEIFISEADNEAATKNVFGHISDRLMELEKGTVEYKRWDNIGGEIALRIYGKAIPRSLLKNLFIAGKGLAGDDAGIVKSFSRTRLEKGFNNQEEVMLVGSLNSKRVFKASTTGNVEIYTTKEMEFLIDLYKKVHPSAKLDIRFFETIRRSEFPEAIRESLKAQNIDVDSVSSIDVSPLATGRHKKVYKMVAKTSKGDKNLIVKVELEKGDISVKEYESYVILGENDITSRPLSRLVEGGVGEKKFYIDEFLEGIIVSDALESKIYTRAEVAVPTGELDAKIMLRTKDFNSDLHKSNLNIFVGKDGKFTIKVVDWDPGYVEQANVYDFISKSIELRTVKKPLFSTSELEYYLNGFVSEIQKKIPGEDGRSIMVHLLERVQKESSLYYETKDILGNYARKMKEQGYRDLTGSEVDSILNLCCSRTVMFSMI